MVYIYCYTDYCKNAKSLGFSTTDPDVARTSAQKLPLTPKSAQALGSRRLPPLADL